MGDEIDAVVFIVHGLGEHCHHYDRIIGHFTSKNIRVYSFDHRGHGRTHQLPGQARRQGHQGHIDVDVKVVMEDIGQLLERAKDDGVEENVPKYLLGHSLGGLMVISYAVTESNELKFQNLRGLITIGKFDNFLYFSYVHTYLCILYCLCTYFL